MRLKYGFLAATLLAAGAGCASTSAEEEQPPAATATEGAEQLPAMQPAPVAAPPVAPAPAAEAPPTTPAAAVAQPPQPQMPQLAMVVIHEVKDFDTWKQAFDEHASARKEAGLLGEGVMRGVDNDKLVAVYSPASDPVKLKAFLESKDLKDKMKTAGVKGKPTVYVFNSAGGKMAPPDKTGLFGAIVQVNVKDFDAFKTAIESQDQARTDAGIIGYGIGQSPDKATEGYLYLQSEDVAKLKAYVTAKETKKAWKDAGAQGQPKATVLKEGEMTMYPK
jgi:quinol monooxygenase YgiN